MGKIDTDYQQQNRKILATFFKLFNRDAAPLSLQSPSKKIVLGQVQTKVGYVRTKIVAISILK